MTLWFVKSTVIIIMAVLLAAGCSVVPEKNSALEQARTAYSRAAHNEDVARKAPLELSKAQQALHETQRLMAAGADNETVAHHAYLTRQRVAIATANARLSAAEDQIKQARSERKDILLQTRTREAREARQLAEQRAKAARNAQRRAEEKAREALMARQEAERALARAQQLSKQVKELKAKETIRGLVLTLGDVGFDTGSAHLKASGMKAVDQLAKFLKDYPERNLLIEGFTDSRGDAAYNKTLSKRRAESVREALIDRGIDPLRMRAEGYGEQFPVASNDTASGRQKNRRIEVVISGAEGDIPERVDN